MGVNSLWKILGTFCKQTPLDWKSLNGKVLAVDLSFWIVEASTAMRAVQFQDPQFRPYLRNTFFRIKHLLSLGVLLVFVIDGAPPPQKFETLKKRGVFGNN